jgi:hypothetical protein
MRTNPFYDAWLFETGNTSDHAASGVGWLLTVLRTRSAAWHRPFGGSGSGLQLASGAISLALTPTESSVYPAVVSCLTCRSLDSMRVPSSGSLQVTLSVT